ncbi:MAG: DUF2807 domain-containing protein [Flavobacteriales bacterium]|nr:DUF2807 domain-containing protein [Flavobacteriales bacterium]
MKQLLPICITLTLILTSCGFLCDIKGNGNLITVERTLTNSFTGVRLESEANVSIISDTIQRVVVFADENIEERILTSVENNTLIIRVDENQSICNATMEVRVYTPSVIQSIQNTSSGKIETMQTMSQPQIALKNSGSGIIDISADANILSTLNTGLGKIIVQGMANYLDVTNTGSGHTECFDLIAQLADVLNTGSGHSKVNVMDTLNVTLTGSGNVYYKGNPITNITDTGSGSVIQQ